MLKGHLPRVIYTLVLYPVSAPLTSCFRMDSISTSNSLLLAGAHGACDVAARRARNLLSLSRLSLSLALSLLPNNQRHHQVRTEHRTLHRVSLDPPHPSRRPPLDSSRVLDGPASGENGSKDGPASGEKGSNGPVEKSSTGPGEKGSKGALDSSREPLDSSLDSSRGGPIDSSLGGQMANGSKNGHDKWLQDPPQDPTRAIDSSLGGQVQLPPYTLNPEHIILNLKP